MVKKKKVKKVKEAAWRWEYHAVSKKHMMDLLCSIADIEGNDKVVGQLLGIQREALLFGILGRRYIAYYRTQEKIED